MCLVRFSLDSGSAQLSVHTGARDTVASRESDAFGVDSVVWLVGCIEVLLSAAPTAVARGCAQRYYRVCLISLVHWLHWNSFDCDPPRLEENALDDATGIGDTGSIDCQI